MPVEEKNKLTITCDNPACPGNDLDPADRTGWLFISSEVYGEPTVQHVFCSTACVNAATSAADFFDTPEEMKLTAPTMPATTIDEPAPTIAGSEPA